MQGTLPCGFPSSPDTLGPSHCGFRCKVVRSRTSAPARALITHRPRCPLATRRPFAMHCPSSCAAFALALSCCLCRTPLTCVTSVASCLHHASPVSHRAFIMCCLFCVALNVSHRHIATLVRACCRVQRGARVWRDSARGPLWACAHSARVSEYPSYLQTSVVRQ